MKNGVLFQLLYPYRVIEKHPQGNIAVSAQHPSDLPAAMAMVNRHRVLAADFVFVSTTGFTGFIGELFYFLNAKAVFFSPDPQRDTWVAVRSTPSPLFYLDVQTIIYYRCFL